MKRVPPFPLAYRQTDPPLALPVIHTLRSCHALSWRPQRRWHALVACAGGVRWWRALVAFWYVPLLLHQKYPPLPCYPGCATASPNPKFCTWGCYTFCQPIVCGGCLDGWVVLLSSPPLLLSTWHYISLGGTSLGFAPPRRT